MNDFLYHPCETPRHFVKIIPSEEMEFFFPSRESTSHNLEAEPVVIISIADLTAAQIRCILGGSLIQWREMEQQRKAICPHASPTLTVSSTERHARPRKDFSPAATDLIQERLHAILETCSFCL